MSSLERLIVIAIGVVILILLIVFLAHPHYFS